MILFDLLIGEGKKYEIKDILDVGGKFSSTIGKFISSPGGILTKLLPYVFILAGLLLFINILSAGFGLLTAAENPKNAESAKQKLTASIFGFVIVVVSYWLVQILEIIFHIGVLK